MSDSTKKSAGHIVAISALILSITVLACYFLYQSKISAVVGMPMLVIGAVVMLLSLLSMTSLLFAANGLQDKTQALALPEGSIRALIAIMLVVLFAILSFFVFGRMADSDLRPVGIMDTEQLAAFARTGTKFHPQLRDDGKFDVFTPTDIPPAAIDYAKQLLVLVGTLVTSIASFYFGAKTVASVENQKALANEKLAVTDVTPRDIPRTQSVKVLLKGTGLARITAITAVNGATRVTASRLTMTPNGDLEAELTFDAASPAGTYQLLLTDPSVGMEIPVSAGLALILP